MIPTYDPTSDRHVYIHEEESSECIFLGENADLARGAYSVYAAVTRWARGSESVQIHRFCPQGHSIFQDLPRTVESAQIRCNLTARHSLGQGEAQVALLDKVGNVIAEINVCIAAQRSRRLGRTRTPAIEVLAENAIRTPCTLVANREWNLRRARCKECDAIKRAGASVGLVSSAAAARLRVLWRRRYDDKNLPHVEPCLAGTNTFSRDGTSYANVRLNCATCSYQVSIESRTSQTTGRTSPKFVLCGHPDWAAHGRR